MSQTPTPKDTPSSSISSSSRSISVDSLSKLTASKENMTYTEIVETTNTKVKYVVRPVKGCDDMPWVELTAIRDKQTPGSKTTEQTSNNNNNNNDPKVATQSELEIKRLIEQHEREAALAKALHKHDPADQDESTTLFFNKKKSSAKSGGCCCKETCQTQIQEAIKMTQLGGSSSPTSSE